MRPEMAGRTSGLRGPTRVVSKYELDPADLAFFNMRHDELGLQRVAADAKPDIGGKLSAPVNPHSGPTAKRNAEASTS